MYYVRNSAGGAMAIKPINKSNNKKKKSPLMKLKERKKNFSDSYRPALTLHYCTSSTLLSWQGEKNYRGIVQVKGTDPYIFQKDIQNLIYG